MIALCAKNYSTFAIQNSYFVSKNMHTLLCTLIISQFHELTLTFLKYYFEKPVVNDVVRNDAQCYIVRQLGLPDVLLYLDHFVVYSLHTSVSIHRQVLSTITSVKKISRVP